MNLIELANYYIENHNLETSPEAIFIEFEFIMPCHTEFEKHLKQNGLNEKLEKMKRNTYRFI
ncbi:hypothetical protein BWZ22_15635 [Seonamhaeicola sp. S2-3]|nr:hypothetical protein BWZ22_15635 [Seonamhaeicola sp. S2-3]